MSVLNLGKYIWEFFLSKIHFLSFEDFRWDLCRKVFAGGGGTARKLEFPFLLQVNSASITCFANSILRKGLSACIY